MGHASYEDSPRCGSVYHPREDRSRADSIVRCSPALLLRPKAYSLSRTPTQLVKALLTPALPDEEDDPISISTDSSQRYNVLSWDSHLLRLCSLETISTSHHPSPKVQAEKDAVGLAINTQLLLSGAARMRGLMQQAQTTEDKKIELAKCAQENEDLAEAIKAITNQDSTTWNADLTWIVARKAIVAPLDEDWMKARRADL